MSEPQSPTDKRRIGASNEDRIRRLMADTGSKASQQGCAARSLVAETKRRTSAEGERAFRLGLDVIRHEVRRAATHCGIAAILCLPVALVSDAGPAEVTVGLLLLIHVLVQIFEVNRRLGEFDRAVVSYHPSLKSKHARWRPPILYTRIKPPKPPEVKADRALN